MDKQAFDELRKLADAVTRRLEASTQANRELRKQAADLAKEATELRDKLGRFQKVAEDQGKLIEAQSQAIHMATEGEIDSSQIKEAIDRILKYGLDLYKEAMSLGSLSADFGTGVSEKDVVGDGVEKTAGAPKYYGVAITNPVEACLLQMGDDLKGTSGFET